jgi:hypothetical protein
MDVRLVDALLLAKSGAATRNRLGCAAGPAVETGAATQPFENGRMLWREDTRQIYVLPDVDEWSLHEDTWASHQAEPDIDPPRGLYAPVRGFGRLWREQFNGPESAIGWATAPEEGTVLLIQGFSNGLLLQSTDGPVWVLYDGGTWENIIE